jgi:predicted acylesterase/phospholipase RssA
MGIQLERKPAVEPKLDIFRPFNEIAVTLSGGGFRASAFSLGCLSYLHRLKYENVSLVERIKFVAATSTGAMTGMAFAAHSRMGQPFSKTYNHLRHNVLVGDRIMKEAARIIKDDKEWKNTPTKNRNSINAFAKVYQKLLFEDLTFEVFWNNREGSVEEVCFNTSEMENGRAFRFQTDGRADTYEILGDRYLRVKDNNIPAIKKLKLGDILAASSCFPIGFEPMVFPDDFAEDEAHKNDLTANTEKAKNYDWEDYETFTRPFALMDGGITDNQGIEGLRLSNERKKARTGSGYDLMLICDAVNYFMDPFVPQKEAENWWNRISLANIINVHKYSVIVFAVSIIMLFVSNDLRLATMLAVVSGIMFSIFLFVRFELVKRPPIPKTIPGQVPEQESLWDTPVVLFLDFFLQNPLFKTEQMLKVRIRSALRVAMEIYLLQIRRINYDGLYSDPEWAYKTKSASIYELSKSNENVLQRQFKRKGFGDELIRLLTPSEKVMQVADYARQMSTTLWFSKTDMREGIDSRRDSLIASGQFTMCYNLLEYIYQIEDKYPEVRTDEAIQTLKKQIMADWAKFQADPMFMIENPDAE